MYNMVTVANIAVWHGKVIRVNPKSSHHRKKFFSFYFIYKIIDVNWTYYDNHFTIYVNQAIILYALTLYSDSCRLFLNKTGREGTSLFLLEGLYNVNVKLLYDFFLLKRLTFLRYFFFLRYFYTQAIVNKLN